MFNLAWVGEFICFDQDNLGRISVFFNQDDKMLMYSFAWLQLDSISVPGDVIRSTTYVVIMGFDA